MIVVRNTFHLKFGKASQAVAVWKAGRVVLKKAGFPQARILTDITGQFYTLVMESQHKSLADFEKSHQSVAASKAWRAWYKKFTALVESGHREIYRTID